MCTICTKSVNDVMRNTNFGGTNINEIPLKGSGFSTTLSSYSNFIDDVYIPLVTDPFYYDVVDKLLPFKGISLIFVPPKFLFLITSFTLFIRIVHIVCFFVRILKQDT